MFFSFLSPSIKVHCHISILYLKAEFSKVASLKAFLHALCLPDLKQGEIFIP